MSKLEQKPTKADVFVDVTSSPYNITEQSGAVFTNKGASATVEFNLPSPSVGKRYHFIRLEDKTIKIFGTVIDESGTTDTQINLEEVGSVLVLVADGTNWNVEFRTVATSFGALAVAVIQQLSAGGIFSGFVEAQSTLTWMWGDNTLGKLGDNTTTDRSSPVSVVGGHDFRSINAGEDHTVFIDADGFAWATGVGSGGSLGNNATGNVSSPVSVVGGHVFTKASAGASRTAAIDDSGFAWTWGDASSGALGDNTTTAKSSPVSVVGAHVFTEITVADGSQAGHMAAIDDSGFAWAWGANTEGNLGDNTRTNRSSPVSVVGAHVFTKISTATNISVAIDDSGFAWCWGENNVGQLGDNSIANRSSPVSVVGGHVFTEISVGGDNSDSGTQFIAAIDDSGFAWCWGYGDDGQMGDNTLFGKSSPVSVVGGLQFSKISAGESHVIALEQGTGVVWGWGVNINGQLGNNTITSESSPVSVVRVFSV